MKLNFSIHYQTAWGQQMVIMLSYRHHDGAERHTRVVMATDDGDYWTAETSAVESRRSPIVAFSYY